MGVRAPNTQVHLDGTWAFANRARLRCWRSRSFYRRGGFSVQFFTHSITHAACDGLCELMVASLSLWILGIGTSRIVVDVWEAFLLADGIDMASAVRAVNDGKEEELLSRVEMSLSSRRRVVANFLT